MGRQVDHLSLAQKNEAQARRLLSDPDAHVVRWGTIAAYYAALHYVHAVLADAAGPGFRHPMTHHDTRAGCSQTLGLEVTEAFARLGRVSERARYLEQFESEDAWLDGGAVEDRASTTNEDLDLVRDAAMSAL